MPAAANTTDPGPALPEANGDVNRNGTLKRRRSVKKKKDSVNPDLVESPLKRQLRETETWTLPEMEQFEALPTAKDRVQFVYNILPEDATGLDRLWPIHIAQKDSRIRRKLSEQGKECFLKGEWSKVLHYYNEACLFSCAKGLGHTLARRAAYLMQTDDIDLAIRDIRIAFDLGCLERELLDFLLAHHTSNDTIRRSTEQSVERSVEALYNPDIPGSEKRRFVHKLRADLAQIQNERKGTPTDEDVENIVSQLKAMVHHNKQNGHHKPNEPSLLGRLPSLPSAPHRMYPSLSSSVDVATDTDKGRKIVSQKPVAVGEVVMIEPPNTTFLCPNVAKLPLLKTHCLHCLTYSRAPLPCDECCVVSFCSVECREKAMNSYHKYECRMKLYEMLHLMGDDYVDVFMAIRTITTHNIKYFMERKAEIWAALGTEFPEMEVAGSPWSPCDVGPVLRLMSHQEDVSAETLMKNAVTAVMFLNALQKANYFEGMVRTRGRVVGSGLRLNQKRQLEEPEILILNVLNHLLNVQSYNSQPLLRLIKARETSEVNFRTDFGEEFFAWDRIGTALCPTVSLINHSCDPNCVQLFVDNHVVVAALKHVPAGTELTLSYDGIHHGTEPLMTRQLRTLRQFFFACECAACEGNWATYDEMPDILYHVPSFEFEKHFVVRTGDKKDAVNEIDRLRTLIQTSFSSGNLDTTLSSLDALSQILEAEISKPHQYHVQADLAASICLTRAILGDDTLEAVRKVDFKARFPPMFSNGVLVAEKDPRLVIGVEPGKKQIKRKKSVKKAKSKATAPEDAAEPACKLDRLDKASTTSCSAAVEEPPCLKHHVLPSQDEVEQPDVAGPQLSPPHGVEQVEAVGDHKLSPACSTELVSPPPQDSFIPVHSHRADSGARSASADTAEAGGLNDNRDEVSRPAEEATVAVHALKEPPSPPLSPVHANDKQRSTACSRVETAPKEKPPVQIKADADNPTAKEEVVPRPSLQTAKHSPEQEVKAPCSLVEDDPISSISLTSSSSSSSFEEDSGDDEPDEAVRFAWMPKAREHEFTEAEIDEDRVIDEILELDGAEIAELADFLDDVIAGPRDEPELEHVARPIIKPMKKKKKKKRRRQGEQRAAKLHDGLVSNDPVIFVPPPIAPDEPEDDADKKMALGVLKRLVGKEKKGKPEVGKLKVSLFNPQQPEQENRPINGQITAEQTKQEQQQVSNGDALDGVCTKSIASVFNQAKESNCADDPRKEKSEKPPRVGKLKPSIFSPQKAETAEKKGGQNGFHSISNGHAERGDKNSRDKPTCNGKEPDKVSLGVPEEKRSEARRGQRQIKAEKSSASKNADDREKSARGSNASAFDSRHSPGSTSNDAAAAAAAAAADDGAINTPASPSISPELEAAGGAKSVKNIDRQSPGRVAALPSVNSAGNESSAPSQGREAALTPAEAAEAAATESTLDKSTAEAEEAAPSIQSPRLERERCGGSGEQMAEASLGRSRPKSEAAAASREPARGAAPPTVTVTQPSSPHEAEVGVHPAGRSREQAEKLNPPAASKAKKRVQSLPPPRARPPPPPSAKIGIALPPSVDLQLLAECEEVVRGRSARRRRK